MEKASLFNNWLTTFKLLSWHNFRRSLSEIFSLNKKLLRFFCKKFALTIFIGISILSVFVVCFGDTAAILVLLFLIPFDFMLAQALFQLKDPSNEVTLKWGTFTFLRWLGATTSSYLLNIILMFCYSIIVIIPFCFVFLCAWCSLSSLRIIFSPPSFFIFSRHLSKAISSQAIVFGLLLPTRLFSGLYFLENGEFLSSILLSTRLILNSLPLLLLAAFGFSFTYGKYALMMAYLPTEISGALSFIVVPTFYIFYLSFFSVIFQRLKTLQQKI